MRQALPPLHDLRKLLRDGITPFLIFVVFRNNDNAIKDKSVVLSEEIGQLVPEPRNCVGFSGARTVLDEVVVTGAMPTHRRQQFTNTIELMITGENENCGDLSSFFVRLLFEV